MSADLFGIVSVPVHLIVQKVRICHEEKRSQVEEGVVIHKLANYSKSLETPTDLIVVVSDVTVHLILRSYNNQTLHVRDMASTLKSCILK